MTSGETKKSGFSAAETPGPARTHWRVTMSKSLVTITAALAIVSLGSLTSAQAGGSTSAPYKYRNWVPTADAYQAPAQQTQRRTQASRSSDITSFSSSSAKNTSRR